MSLPKPYRKGLTPSSSSLHPHCLAQDRLHCWKPIKEPAEDGAHPELSDLELERILDMMNFTWAPRTCETYGAGLLVFHVFCDQRIPPVPEVLRGPASEQLLLNFLSSCASAYSGTALKNYFYGVQAWHTLHGLPWNMDDTRMSAALTAVARLAPPTSKRAKRKPFTPAIISKIREHLDLSDPLDATVFACLTTTFWSGSRLGEFTVPSIRGFDPNRHVKRSNTSVVMESGELRLPVTTFRLPWTKCAPNGEDVHWAPQSGNPDPAAALENHLSINNPGPDEALFAWRHPRGLRPLSRSEFMKRINAAAAATGLEPLQGHGIRIGSVLEYLLRGLPFEVVRTMGWWSSDAFVLYLRKHATILAPYIQSTLILEPFTRIAMLPVR